MKVGLNMGKSVLVYLNMFSKRVKEKGLIILHVISHSRTIFSQFGSQSTFNKSSWWKQTGYAASLWYKYVTVRMSWILFSPLILISSVRITAVSSLSLVPVSLHYQSPRCWYFESLTHYQTSAEKQDAHLQQSPGKGELQNLCICASLGAFYASPTEQPVHPGR